MNGIVEYSIAAGDGTGIGNNDGVGRNRITTADGYGYFSINLPHQGQVTVNRTLDFERTQRYLVTILASVSTYSLTTRLLTYSPSHRSNLDRVLLCFCNIRTIQPSFSFARLFVVRTFTIFISEHSVLCIVCVAIATKR